MIKMKIQYIVFIDGFFWNKQLYVVFTFFVERVK